jgi:hypothetical protein
LTAALTAFPVSFFSRHATTAPPDGSGAALGTGLPIQALASGAESRVGSGHSRAASATHGHDAQIVATAQAICRKPRMARIVRSSQPRRASFPVARESPVPHDFKLV